MQGRFPQGQRRWLEEALSSCQMSPQQLHPGCPPEAVVRLGFVAKGQDRNLDALVTERDQDPMVGRVRGRQPFRARRAGLHRSHDLDDDAMQAEAPKMRLHHIALDDTNGLKSVDSQDRGDRVRAWFVGLDVDVVNLDGDALKSVPRTSRQGPAHSVEREQPAQLHHCPELSPVQSAQRLHPDRLRIPARGC